MKKISVIFSMIILLITGCENTQSLITEKNIKSMDEYVKRFVNNEETNGNYIFSNTGKSEYLIVNRKSVIQGTEASYIKSIKAKINDKTLEIYLDEPYTMDYQDKRLGKIRIFKLDNSNHFDSIQVYKNGHEEPISVVGN